MFDISTDIHYIGVMLRNNRCSRKLFFLKGDTMSNPKAEQLSALDFINAYVNTHQTGGPLADGATMINRTIGQTRSKRNSVSVELKKRGVTLPQLNRMETVGSSSLAYDEVANLVKSYVNEDTLLANLKDS